MHINVRRGPGHTACGRGPNVRYRFYFSSRLVVGLTATLLAVCVAAMSGCSLRVMAPNSPASQPSVRETTAGVVIDRDGTEVQGLLSSLASPATTATSHDREIRLLAAADPKRLVHWSRRRYRALRIILAR